MKNAILSLVAICAATVAQAGQPIVEQYRAPAAPTYSVQHVQAPTPPAPQLQTRMRTEVQTVNEQQTYQVPVTKTRQRVVNEQYTEMETRTRTVQKQIPVQYKETFRVSYKPVVERVASAPVAPVAATVSTQFFLPVTAAPTYQRSVRTRPVLFPAFSNATQNVPARTAVSSPPQTVSIGMTADQLNRPRWFGR